MLCTNSPIFSSCKSKWSFELRKVFATMISHYFRNQNDQKQSRKRRCVLTRWRLNAFLDSSFSVHLQRSLRPRSLKNTSRCIAGIRLTHAYLIGRFIQSCIPPPLRGNNDDTENKNDQQNLSLNAIVHYSNIHWQKKDARHIVFRCSVFGEDRKRQRSHHVKLLAKVSSTFFIIKQFM